MSAEFLTNLAAIAVGGFVIWGLWTIAQPRAVFEIHLLDGTLQVKAGKVTAVFLQAIEEIAETNDVSDAIIRGYPDGRRIRLDFSGDMPSECQQQLRNWWAEHGWVPPRSRTKRRRA